MVNASVIVSKNRTFQGVEVLFHRLLTDCKKGKDHYSMTRSGRGHLNQVMRISGNPGLMCLLMGGNMKLIVSPVKLC